MRRLPSVLILAALAPTLVAGCAGTKANTGIPTGDGTNPLGLQSAVFAADKRNPAPGLSGSTLDGSSLDTSQLLGKVVVVNFWASWCAPCRAEAGNLNAVYDATKALGVSFVGVDIRDERTSGQAFQRAKAVDYPSLFDQSGTLLLKFRGQAPQNPPTTLLIDRKGRIAARFVQPVTESELLAPVQQLAKEPA